MDTIQPIYLVGGSKGGVGKSMVTLALADHLQRLDTHAVLVETDTSNPDVSNCPQPAFRPVWQDPFGRGMHPSQRIAETPAFRPGSRLTGLKAGVSNRG